jgi:hypothetical protein
MEHKWAIFYHQRQIICIRSWTRQVRAVADVRDEGDSVAITAIRGTFGEEEEPAFTARVLDYLLRSHALGEVYPVPLPPDAAASPDVAATWCFSWFGNRALFATPHEVTAPPPTGPLRTHSLLHMAVARGDAAATDRFLDSGLPVDLLAGDGLAPMHWAVARDDTAMLRLLLERGSPVDVRSSEGATPLMNAVQALSVEKVAFLLDQGADPDAADHRGFTALHRAAERGQIQIVELLLDRGASPDPQAQGHTPRSLAEARSETAVVERLDRGAAGR